jgi:hypothetical protein
MAPLVLLIQKLQEGTKLIGTYHRRAVQEQSKIMFDKLVVKTVNGSDYMTTNPLESELFFELTDITGTGANSGYSQEESCYYYESMGYWLTSAGARKVRV